MSIKQMTSIVLCLSLLCSPIAAIGNKNGPSWRDGQNHDEQSEDSEYVKQNPQFDDSDDDDDDCCDDPSRLTLRLLCAKYIKAKCIDVRNIHSKHLCSDTIATNTICANQINIANALCVPEINSPSICTQQLVTTDACVGGTLKVNQLDLCMRYKASVTFSTDTLYPLGTPFAYDVILDDPNGNISLVPFTTYTVPESGYYIAMLQTDETQLISPLTILGAPIARSEILVNGALFRFSYFPFLTFFDQQRSTHTVIMSLNAGDVVSVQYNVLAGSSSGVILIPGTVVAAGNGTESTHCVFKIHYLSSKCDDGSPVCPPCSSLVPCATQCDHPCVPCHTH